VCQVLRNFRGKILEVEELDWLLYCLAGKLKENYTKGEQLIKIVKKINKKESKNLLISNLSTIEQVLKGKRLKSNT